MYLIYFLVHLHGLNVHKWSVGASTVHSIVMRHNTLVFVGLSLKSESHLCIYSGQFSRYKWARECLCGSCGHLTVPPSVANGQFLWFDVGGMCTWSPSIPTSPLIDRTLGESSLTFDFYLQALWTRASFKTESSQQNLKAPAVGLIIIQMFSLFRIIFLNKFFFLLLNTFFHSNGCSQWLVWRCGQISNILTTKSIVNSVAIYEAHLA